MKLQQQLKNIGTQAFNYIARRLKEEPAQDWNFYDVEKDSRYAQDVPYDDADCPVVEAVHVGDTLTFSLWSAEYSEIKHLGLSRLGVEQHVSLLVDIAAHMDRIPYPEGRRRFHVTDEGTTILTLSAVEHRDIQQWFQSTQEPTYRDTVLKEHLYNGMDVLDEEEEDPLDSPTPQYILEFLRELLGEFPDTAYIRFG